jgi:hypothetical protein
VARPSLFSVEDKYRLVLAVISGELTMAEAARRGKASEQSISRRVANSTCRAKAHSAGLVYPGPQYL